MIMLANQNRGFFFKNCGRSNRDIFLWEQFFIQFQRFLNCIFSVHAVCTAHDYCIIVTHTLHLSTKKRIIMCFSDKRLLLFTAIVTATIFVIK